VTEDLRALFHRHVCQTSSAPLGIVVARAAGSTVWDASGRPYLDLLAGMGVANVGHTHRRSSRRCARSSSATST
jgi:4-aminobutyrate aminotransferase-like enzyme